MLGLNCHPSTSTINTLCVVHFSFEDLQRSVYITIDDQMNYVRALSLVGRKSLRDKDEELN